MSRSISNNVSKTECQEMAFNASSRSKLNLRGEIGRPEPGPAVRKFLAGLIATSVGLFLWSGTGTATVAATRTAAPVLGVAEIDSGVLMIQEALDEFRFIDAERMLDDAAVAGVKDDRLTLLSGELDLRRHEFKSALTSFDELERRAKVLAPEVLIRTRCDRGITLSLLGKSDEALRTLEDVVKLYPDQWRAWNALGAEYDARRDWINAEIAYGKAIKTSNAEPTVLNNRGYSRLIQRRFKESIVDLVAALSSRPNFPEARANLRLALAASGDYERAIEGDEQDKAVLFNNAGFAAALQGDYGRSRELFNKAIALKGEYYERAAENLKMIEPLAPGRLAAH